MRLERLRIENLRAFEKLDLALEPRWNFFVGANGAGKTTLLEAAYLLSHARSFRSAARDALTRHGADGYSIFGTVGYSDGSLARVGLSRAGNRVEARIDGESSALSGLLRRVAVVCFEPGSHELIAGPAELRRRFLDWGVFHVEPDFLTMWRRFHRALAQRSALLKGGAGPAELDAWDTELAEAGEAVMGMRRNYIARFAHAAAARCAGLLGELGTPEIRFGAGWPAEATLAEQLAVSRDDDLRRGFSGYGPHRADWSVVFARAPRREHLSRGQEKLCALGCTLAQAEVFAADCGEWPIVCVDDLASELDGPHQEGLLSALPESAQVLLTGTEVPAAFGHTGRHAAMFHVEPSRVSPLL